MSATETQIVDFILQLETEGAEQDLGKLRSELMRVLHLLRRLTGNESLDKGLTLIQRTMTALNALRVAYLATQMAAGPVGWVTAAVSWAGAGLTATDTLVWISSQSRGY